MPRGRRDHLSMLPTKAVLSRRLARHVDSEIYDESAALSGSVAIYTLVDPRELRQTRYVGQTAHPRRRFLQHLNTARLWFPEDRPWWVKSPKLRPLYSWIRDLYADESRLPTMIICGWAESGASARLRERAQIVECLTNRLPLLNVESERFVHQPPLL